MLFKIHRHSPSIPIHRHSSSSSASSAVEPRRECCRSVEVRRKALRRRVRSPPRHYHRKRMGAIKEGKVCGILPENREALFAVQYPGYPCSLSHAIHTLGGLETLQKARSSSLHRLELRFRPQDPFSRPAFGALCQCTNFLLKISKTKTQQHRAHIIAPLNQAYHFDGMADYQHVVSVHAHVTRSKKRPLCDDPPNSGTEKKAQSHVHDDDDVMLLVPPLFAPKDVPEHVVLKPSITFTSKKNQELPFLRPHLEIDMEPVLAIDFNINEIPKRINWEEFISEGSDQWELQMAVSRLFDERPIWIKHSLNERLVDNGYNFVGYMLRRLLSRVAYYFSSGPFLRFWIKKGYDPRKDPESRIYQRIDFRVHQSLRSYCETNTANQSSQKWEEICGFRVFPFKCQTSLQLFELVDDYIQQEIRKPPIQKTCSNATGWFSFAMLDNWRQRIAIRFLSAYPKSGAEHLLKEVSDKFEKSKRRLNKDYIMLREEERREVDQVNEDAKEPNNVEDDEEEEVEVENEEDDDDDDDDDEISIQAHSYMKMDDISRSHLQELFESFPLAEVGDDKIQNAANTSDEEYQIFEDSDEDNY